MNERVSNVTPDRSFRIPIGVVAITAGIVVVLVAIFVFRVAASAAVTYAMFGLMIFAHLFMHGHHGSHGDNHEHTGPIDDTTGDADAELNYRDCSGSCH